MIRRLAIQIPGAVIKEGTRTVEFPSGGWVQVRSADGPDSLRGEGLSFVVVDEAAFLSERAWTEGLRPALADQKGGALIISTPNGRNWFWQLYQQAQADLSGEYAAWHFTSYDNPFLDPAEINSAKHSLPERVFRQEFMAEFMEDGAGVFRRVAEAATVGIGWPRIDGHTYVFGVDWARSNDYTVFAVLDLDTKALVCIDRFNDIDYATQMMRLRALNERWKPSLIIAEKNSMGGPLVEMLQNERLPVQAFTTTSQSKAQIVDTCVLAFERDDIHIINDPILVAELQAFEMERLPSGMIRYTAPEGMHDDCVMALCLAWSAVGQWAGQTIIKRKPIGMRA